MDDKIKETITRVKEFSTDVNALLLADECERLHAQIDAVCSELGKAQLVEEMGEVMLAALRGRLSQYECPQHPEPEFGECDECDKHDQSVEATPL